MIQTSLVPIGRKNCIGQSAGSEPEGHWHLTASCAVLRHGYDAMPASNSIGPLSLDSWLGKSFTSCHLNLQLQDTSWFGAFLLTSSVHLAGDDITLTSSFDSTDPETLNTPSAPVLGETF
jgi:hypothetical protein